MAKRYLVMPGKVASKNDGNVHYVNARQLMDLYNVDPKECIIYKGDQPLGYRNLIVLRPRYDGNYSLTEGVKNEDQN